MRQIVPILWLLALSLSACQPLVASTPMAVEAAAEESTAPDSTIAVNFYSSHAAHERFGKIDLNTAPVRMSPNMQMRK
ncbi:MAG: hypothetical protein R2911_10955 [Caldilineaceae bacterium]